MEITKTLLTAAALSCVATFASAQEITFFFETDDANEVTGGDLVLTEAGTGATNTFESDRFEGFQSASFQVQNIPTIGTLTATMSVSDVLNVTTAGLADGSSGFGSGEFVTFSFDKDVIITGLDFASFTSGGSDTVNISAGATDFGNFSDDSIFSSPPTFINFTDPNNVTSSITLSANDDFTIAFISGDYDLEEISFTVVPEPGTYALLSGFCALGFVMLRRRK